jgi:hypothetical protein
MAEFSLGMLGSPSGFSPVSFNPNSDSENTDAESESSIPAAGWKNKEKIKKTLRFFGPSTSKAIDERMEKVSEFSQMLTGQSKPKYSPFKKLCIQELENSDPFEFTVPSSSKGLVSEKKRIMAEAAYELTDDNFDVDVPEKLSTYRKKRLAEKMSLQKKMWIEPISSL